FAHIEVGAPVIRRGKSGHFYDKGLEGVAHHAVIPNMNVLDDLEPRLGRLSDDEKRLFALICRSYLAAVMPDYEYRQTIATVSVPVPGGPAEFRATGHIPLRLGWKTVYGALLPEKDGEGEHEQTLPPLSDGEAVTLTDPKVEAKRTQPPPRYSEGTLVEAMQNAWRFVKDPGLRDRLKEAKGIGTPPPARRSSRGSSDRACWRQMASSWCQHRRGCRYSSCCGASRRASLTRRQRQHGRCNSTISFPAAPTSGWSSTASPRWRGR